MKKRRKIDSPAINWLMEDTTASSVVKVFKNDKGKTSKTLGRVVSIVAMSSGRPKINILKVLDYLIQSI